MCIKADSSRGERTYKENQNAEVNHIVSSINHYISQIFCSLHWVKLILVTFKIYQACIVLLMDQGCISTISIRWRMGDGTCLLSTNTSKQLLPVD